MKSLIIQLFGTYTPVTTTEIINYTVEDVTHSSFIEVVASGAAGVDWPWVMGVLLFAICLWSFFRLLGIVLGGK